MAGQFTHILVAKHALDGLQVKTGLPFLNHKSYIYAGAVAPDLPYFLKGYGSSFDWAERMHHKNTKEAILAGLEYLDKKKSIESEAWFMGYIAHVITDMTIHPVVNAISGPYYTSKKVEEAQHSHRYTEMIQDSFVVSEFCQSDFNLDDFSKMLLKVSNKISNREISEKIKNIWIEMLRSSDEDLFKRKVPKIDKWYDNYLDFMTNPVDASVLKEEELVKFLGVKAILYKDINMINEAILKKYITNLPFPEMSNEMQYILESKPLNYSDVFNRTVLLVMDIWEMIYSRRIEFEKILNDWSLDTGGIIGEESHRSPVFW